jgi:PGF-pre-PGF domain-containing protein
MNKKTGIFSGIFLLFFFTQMVLAAPQPPHQFYGNVTIDNSSAPDGSTISVKIDGVEYGSTTTADGKYGYNPLFFVPADDLSTGDKEGGVDGEILQFYVNDSWATSYIFGSGNVTKLDLSPLPNILPVASFTYSPSSPQSGDTVTFYDTSYDTNGTIVSWLWNFGDGSTSSEQNVTHIYTSSGTFTVTLTVTDNLGGMNSTSKEIQVSAAPAPDETPPPSGGGGGGGGGLLPPPLTAPSEYSTSFVKYMNAGKLIVMEITSEVLLDAGITEIGAQLGETKRASVTISKVSSLPAGVVTPEGNIYTYFEVVFVEFGTLNELEPSGYIKFRVPKAWLNSVGAKATDIQFLKYTDGNWVELEMEMESEDDYYNYIINLDSFSLFAVVAKSKVSPPITIPTFPEQTPEEAVTEEEAVKTPEATPTVKPAKDEFPLLYAAGGLLVVIAAIVVVFLTKRKS